MMANVGVRIPMSGKALLILGATLLAISQNAGAMGKVQLKTTENVDRPVPVGVLKRINVSNTGGNIVVTGDPGARNITISAVKAVWEKTPGRARKALALLDVSVRAEGELLDVRPTHPDNWDKTFEVEFFVTVPASFRVEASSASGAIQVRNVREVDISGQTGDILLSQVRSITVKTVAGDVEIESSPGPLDITTESGIVRARLAGDVKSVRVLTTSGDVTFQVPPRLGAELGITTTSGIVNTRGLTLRDVEQTRFGMRATLNDGGVPIEVTSTSGAVTVSTAEIGPSAVRQIGPPQARPIPGPAPAPPPPPEPAPRPEPEPPAGQPTPPAAETPAPSPEPEPRPAQPAPPAPPDTTGAQAPAGETAPTQPPE